MLSTCLWDPREMGGGVRMENEAETKGTHQYAYRLKGLIVYDRVMVIVWHTEEYGSVEARHAV